MMVCADCLRVLVDTIPAWVPEKEQGTQDVRFNQQLKSFEKQALEAIKAIEEKGGTAFDAKATTTRVGGTTSSQLSGSIRPTN
jgi:ribosome maturation protein Sdo1